MITATPLTISPADQPVFRFAPSPNGALHLGHAASALINDQLCQQHNGRFLLRMEDIDTTRCSPAFEEQIYEDLHWLGLQWETPARRQSDHFDDYQSALDALVTSDLVYPGFLSRNDVRRIVAAHEEAGDIWPRDPDGAPLYPDIDRHRSNREREKMRAENHPHTWRLNMIAAMEHVKTTIEWQEFGDNTHLVREDPSRWGDVVLARSDTPASYHLAVVVDDALQGITHIVRGQDLYQATAVHRLLQELLGLTPPLYHHHPLILGGDGRKLSKSNDDTSLKALRDAGSTLDDIRRMVGFAP